MYSIKQLGGYAQCQQGRAGSHESRGVPKLQNATLWRLNVWRESGRRNLCHHGYHLSDRHGSLRYHAALNHCHEATLNVNGRLSVHDGCYVNGDVICVEDCEMGIFEK